MKRICVLMAALLLLGGCNASGYYQKQTHYSLRADTPVATDSEAISGREDLYQAIKNAVDVRKSREKLTIQGYDGDWKTDLEEICRAIQEDYPYGKYAVETIASMSKQVYTQTQVDLTIYYRDSADDLQSIPYTVSMSDFEQRVMDLLGSFTAGPGSEDATSRAFLFSDFSDDDATLQERLIKCWVQNADSALDLREMSAKAYSAETAECIIEVYIQYLENREALLAKREALRTAAAAIAEDFSGESDRDRVDFVYRYLWEHVQYDLDSFSGMPKYSRQTAYGPLVEGYGAQSGHALAAQVLCKALGLNSTVVVGEKGEHGGYYWLYVWVDGAYMHFDPTAMRGLDAAVVATEPAPGDDEEAQEAALDYSGHGYLFDVQDGARLFSWNEAVYYLEK